MELIITSDEEMQVLGENLSSILSENDIVFLIGELGVGKTTLVKGLAKGLNYKENVSSPTFSLMNIYETSPKIYHFDFYRLEGCEITDIGIDDYLHNDGIAIIEWANIGGDQLPEADYLLYIDLIDDDYDNPRKVTIKANSQKIEELSDIVSVSGR
ncbi:tRNA threonylcarbamoyladenosine biosynthesis protein TsaE [Candidatus Syntrophocurvum alkaliphilum]|uniref:tRNA threonylcarbamoyladenosine biosynthesis protein TsaE n=1 Tax=Candidatus Syntrophocurvum alkaliphilum TaxID=2293317 RepID=A0A6I6DC56_9FIRM|nr:tRNA (adenosine(37)-N6)-threonylcarbamoyltransferase complex ATPase subunit type 1 TsaE [Candidatus Syntrophocurvum alkaliphilum]QGT98750.1 tRNA threonylcarbamoyladenosine biosynthesis protein TsaE [Candidatus Syntrophocurvum alkaliphilum]